MVSLLVGIKKGYFAMELNIQNYCREEATLEFRDSKTAITLASKSAHYSRSNIY